MMTDRQYILAYSEYVPTIKTGATYNMIRREHPELGEAQIRRLRRILGVSKRREAPKTSRTSTNGNIWKNK